MKKRIILKNDIEQLKNLEIFIEDIGKDLSLDLSITMQLNLALEEAISNIIHYSYDQNESDKQIIVEFENIGDELTFTLTDSGKEFDPTKATAPDISLPIEDREIGGLGIFLIHKLMDRVEYRRAENQNILTIKKRWELNNENL